MIKLDRILVPTDFSEFSRPALLYGCAMAARFDAELHLLHVVPDPAMLIPELAQFSAESLQTQTNRLLDDARKKLNAIPGGDWMPSKPVVREVLIGPAFMEIVEYAEKQNMDLLVIGTHGRSGLMHLLMGSVAERVVRKASCPVLTVKPQGHQIVEP